MCLVLYAALLLGGHLIPVSRQAALVGTLCPGALCSPPCCTLSSSELRWSLFDGHPLVGTLCQSLWLTFVGRRPLDGYICTYPFLFVVFLVDPHGPRYTLQSFTEAVDSLSITSCLSVCFYFCCLQANHGLFFAHGGHHTPSLTPTK